MQLLIEAFVVAVRNEEAHAADLKTDLTQILFRSCPTLTHALRVTLSRTGEFIAVLEVHTLHAFGENELVGST